MGQPADRALFSSRGVGLDFYPTHNQDLSLDLDPPPLLTPLALQPSTACDPPWLLKDEGESYWSPK